MDTTLHHLSLHRVEHLRRQAELHRLARTTSPRRPGGRFRRAARAGEASAATERAAP